MSNKKLRNQKLQKFLVLFSRILGIIVILTVVLLLIPLSLPRILGYETYNVVSGSMEPEISVGSLLLVKSIDPSEVQEGDIITFCSNATVVSHRVVKNNKFESKFITKGDANETNDLSPVQYDELIGIVKYHIPFMGTLGAYASTTSGKLLMGELIVCAILLYTVSAKIKI